MHCCGALQSWKTDLSRGQDGQEGRESISFLEERSQHSCLLHYERSDPNNSWLLRSDPTNSWSESVGKWVNSSTRGAMSQLNMEEKVRKWWIILWHSKKLQQKVTSKKIAGNSWDHLNQLRVLFRIEDGYLRGDQFLEMVHDSVNPNPPNTHTKLNEKLGTRMLAQSGASVPSCSLASTSS